MSKKIIQLNEGAIKDELKELVRGSVEETLNGQPPILCTGEELGFRPQADNSTVCGAGGR